MKLQIITITISGLFLLMSCGGDEEQKPTAVEEEEVTTAADLLERARREIYGEVFNDAIESLNELLKNYPDAEEATEAKELIEEAEAILATRVMEAGTQAHQAEELIAKLLKVPGEEYDSYYDPTVYEMEESKVYLELRLSRSGEPVIRLAIDHYYSADEPTLGIERFTMKVGHQPFPIIPRANELTTETLGNQVKESLNTRPVFMHRGMIEAIITTDGVVLLAEAESRNEERELNPVEKQGLDNVLTAFTTLGGVWGGRFSP